MTTNSTSSGATNSAQASGSPASGKLLSQAQDRIGGAIGTTVGAVKDHPVTAAAIAAGAAAAVAGAAYGVSKYREKGSAK